MTVVIDVGCATYGGDNSIDYLIDEFAPSELWGYDPSCESSYYQRATTQVITHRAAVWKHDRGIGFTINGTSGKIGEGPLTPCVDLLRIVRAAHDLGGPVILKLDAERSEYELLEYLHRHQADRLLKLAWVEWHCLVCDRGGGHREGCDDQSGAEWRARLEQSLDCELHQWNR